eukprot:scaffold11354_cov71-Skeletonema_dohrnii-CCMP3373.AAC.1
MGRSVSCKGLLHFQGKPKKNTSKAAHLNGKIGEVRDVDMKEKEDGSKYFDKDNDRCVVHFEDKSLKPVRVKATNLRVVFDLPAATAVDN